MSRSSWSYSGLSLSTVNNNNNLLLWSWPPSVPVWLAELSQPLSILRRIIHDENCQQNLHHSSKIKNQKGVTNDKTVENLGFSYYFSLITEGSGAVLVTKGSGSRMPKNIQIRMRIHNNANSVLSIKILRKKIIFVGNLKVTNVKSRILSRIRIRHSIRIRTKMSRIRNTGDKCAKIPLSIVGQCAVSRCNSST